MDRTASSGTQAVERKFSCWDYDDMKHFEARPQEDPLTVHCFCVWSDSIFLGISLA